MKRYWLLGFALMLLPLALTALPAPRVLAVYNCQVTVDSYLVLDGDSAEACETGNALSSPLDDSVHTVYFEANGGGVPYVYTGHVWGEFQYQCGGYNQVAGLRTFVSRVEIGAEIKTLTPYGDGWSVGDPALYIGKTGGWFESDLVEQNLSDGWCWYNMLGHGPQ